MKTKQTKLLMCQRIFISYKRVDKKIVFPIKDYIEKNVGETCWIDLDGIESDAQFVNVIMNAIDNASVFLFMYSQAHSIIEDYLTDWTVRELNYAQKKGKRIVFINIDKYPLSDYFLFMFPQKQQVDATSKDALQKLCHDLKAWLNIETPTPTPPPPPPPKPEWLKKIKSFISNTIKNIWHGVEVIVKWISSKAKTIAIVICCAAAIALGWMFIPQIISIFNNEEAKAWRAAKQENTLASYADFIEKYGQSRHVDAAMTNIIRTADVEKNIEGLSFAIFYKDSCSISPSTSEEIQDSINSLCARWTSFASDLNQQVEKYTFDRDYSQSSEQEYLAKMVNDALSLDFILTSMHNAFLKRVNDTTSQLITSQLISVEDSIFYTLKNIQDKFETGRSVLSDGQYYAPYEYKSFYVQAIENIDKYFANRRYSGLSISN